jgi:hypothetical protein
MTRLVVAGRPYLVETAPGLTPEPQAQPVSSSNRSLREPAADTSFREIPPASWRTVDLVDDEQQAELARCFHSGEE